jgi:DNA-binding NarL/FixJ family response regulator
MNMIKMLLVEDHSVVRAGLRALLQTAGDIQVIGEAENGAQGVRAAQRLRPDVVLLDLGMPRLNGIEAARQIIHQAPTTKVLMLSAYSDEQHVREAVAAGVAGYVLKQSSSTDLLDAIRETAGGGAYFSPGVANQMLRQLRQSWAHGPATTPNTPTLSRRNAEVLQLIAEGYCTKQIAELLSISQKTAEKHRYALMMTLDIHKTAVLTRYAVSTGVIESNCLPTCLAKMSSAPPRQDANNIQMI